MAGITRRALRLALVGILLSAACSGPPPPITLQDDIVVIQNQTKRPWRKVVITVNDHFRGGSAELAAGQRMTAPLSGFQTAFGQHFDHTRQTVSKIELTAVDDNSAPVALTWDGHTERERR